MKTLIDIAAKTLSQPQLVLGFILLISVFSIASALTAEVAFGLEPCILCIYQRIPFLITTLCAAIGLFMKHNKSAMIALSSIAFAINSSIATYHTGVEQKWWVSAVEGCAVPNFGDNPQTMLENIFSAPTANCAEIPWSDPILGLSMANYNIALCFGMFVLCALSFVSIKAKSV